MIRAILRLLLVVLFFGLAHAYSVEALRFRDQVRTVKVEQGDVRVTFSNHAAIYRVSAKNPSFDLFKKRLEETMSTKKSVAVTADPFRMEILKLSTN